MSRIVREAGLVISGRIFYHPEVGLYSTDGVAPPPSTPTGTGLGPEEADLEGTASQEEAEEEEEEEELARQLEQTLLVEEAENQPSAEGPKPHVPGDPLEDGKIRGLLVGVDLGGASSESAATARRHRAGAGGSGGGARGKKIPPALPAAPGSFVPPSRPDFAPLGWAEHPGGAQLIIVDAPNVAMRHGGRRKCFSCKGIQIVLEYWLQRGHKKDAATLSDSALGNKGKAIKAAGYWDYIEKAGQARGEALQWIRSHCISFAFAGDEFMPNPDFHFLSS
eukprot:gene3950-4919_t